MTRKLFGALTALLLAAFTQFAVAEGAPMHRIAMHVDENDPQLMNLTLNNASNVFKHYSDLNESVQIEIVTYGPGLHMLRSDTSPVKDRIETIAATYDGISFQACGNTMANMKKKSGKDVPLLPQASIVPSGVVHLVQRQEEGWAYIRP